MPVVLDDGRLRTLALGNEVVGRGGETTRCACANDPERQLVVLILNCALAAHAPTPD